MIFRYKNVEDISHLSKRYSFTLMFTSSNKDGVYQASLPLEGNEELIESHLPVDKILWHLAQNYTFTDEGDLDMDVYLSYNDEKSPYIESHNLLSITIPQTQFKEYRKYLYTVLSALNAKIVSNDNK